MRIVDWNRKVGCPYRDVVAPFGWLTSFERRGYVWPHADYVKLYYVITVIARMVFIPLSQDKQKELDFYLHNYQRSQALTGRSWIHLVIVRFTVRFSVNENQATIISMLIKII